MQDLNKDSVGNRIKVPKHVAIVMDGNRRWAEAKKLPKIEGHRQGVTALRRTMEAAKEAGVKYLTVYGFSTENWSRSAEETSGLMGLLRFYLKNEIKNLAKNKIRLRFIGDPEPLDKDIRDLMLKAESDTAGYDDFHLIIALNYGARDELKRAVQHLSEQVQRGALYPSDITEAMVSEHLYTNLLPDPDLLIRPGGEIRVSNFLLWQIAYAEFYFTDVLWPDFDKQHFMEALTEFAKRKRRFGGYDSEDDK